MTNLIEGFDVNNSILYNTNPDDDKSHFIVLGTTGSGESQIIPGAPVEMSDAEINERRASIQEQQLKEQKQEQHRNKAIKQTYIDHGGDLSFIDESLKAADLIPCDSEISSDTLKQILFELDDSLFYQGLTWGFDDTEVRDDIYIWLGLEPNLEKIKQILS